MIITPLGHTEFLIDIENDIHENIRIMVDAWLSDYAIGDLMERSIKVELDREKLSTIDAIYISHAHCDHFDPYTLVEIYKHSRPLLLLPFTLQYLVPLIREYLGMIPLEILFPGKPFFLKGIEITGHVFPQNTITNEDDVMMLGIENESELLFAEIDTLPEEDDIEAQKKLYKILTKKKYTTVCYLASRNELPGQLPILDLPPKKRKGFRDTYIAGRKEEMYFSYQKYEYEDFTEFSNIYTIPNLVRGFIGQGICYPRAFSLDFARVQIFPLEEIASMETDIASECGYEFPQKALLPGRQYIIENAHIETGRKECPIGKLIIDRERGNLETTDIRLYADGPLMPISHSGAGMEQLKKQILDVLNYRFLPYWSASPMASLRSSMIENGGAYRIECKMKNGEGRIVFEYTFAGVDFQEIPYSEGMRIDESYWIQDVLDFLDGRQELYSNFWHKLDSKMIYRLWTCLGANFCNNDFVIKKYRLHFERSTSGMNAESYAKEAYKNISK